MPKHLPEETMTACLLFESRWRIFFIKKRRFWMSGVSMSG